MHKKLAEENTWREKIDQQLGELCDEKLLRGGLKTAQKILIEARKRLPQHGAEVWAARINYREAHLCMRFAGLVNVQGETGEATRLYTEAARLFREAEIEPCYTQLARIYGLPAALHAGEIVANDFATRHERLHRICLTRNQEIDREIQIEANMANLVEISAYYAGFWSDALEGHSKTRKSAKTFTLLSSDLTFAHLAMTKDFAFNEVQNIVDTGEYAFAIRVKCLKPDVNAEYICPSVSEWKPVTKKALIPVLLALLVGRDGHSPTSWYTLFLSGVPSENDASLKNNFRKYKNDLQHWFKEIGMIASNYKIFNQKNDIQPTVPGIFIACPQPQIKKIK